MPSSKLWLLVGVITNVAEEHVTSIFRVEINSERGPDRTHIARRGQGTIKKF
jgi:hypothetical protein